MTEEFARVYIKNLQERQKVYQDRPFYGEDTLAIIEGINIQIDCIKQTMTEMGHDGFR